MSTHLALTRRGHLEQLYHIFVYLQANPKHNLFFDPQHPTVDERAFKEYDWYDFYRDAKERLPSDMPPPRGRLVSTHCFVDSDHAGDKVMHRSQTGILIFLNRAPIIWYSKRQNTVETSTFGSEFITMKMAVEQIESLRYKLRMFGVPLEGPTNVFCDNESVFKNVSQPDSVENSSSRFYLISCSQGILNSSRLLLLSSPKIACLHVSFTAYENFYKLSKMHCHLVLTFLFLILRMSEYRNPTIKHISTYTLVSSSITIHVTDLFLGSNLHSKIPF